MAEAVMIQPCQHEQLQPAFDTMEVCTRAGGAPLARMMVVSARCAKCGQQMRFKGLNRELNLTGPTRNEDQTQAFLPYTAED